MCHLARFVWASRCRRSTSKEKGSIRRLANITVTFLNTLSSFLSFFYSITIIPCDDLAGVWEPSPSFGVWRLDAKDIWGHLCLKIPLDLALGVLGDLIHMNGGEGYMASTSQI